MRCKILLAVIGVALAAQPSFAESRTGRRDLRLRCASGIARVVFNPYTSWAMRGSALKAGLEMARLKMAAAKTEFATDVGQHGERTDKAVYYNTAGGKIGETRFHTKADFGGYEIVLERRTRTGTINREVDRTSARSPQQLKQLLSSRRISQQQHDGELVHGPANLSVTSVKVVDPDLRAETTTSRRTESWALRKARLTNSTNPNAPVARWGKAVEGTSEQRSWQYLVRDGQRVLDERPEVFGRPVKEQLGHTEQKYYVTSLGGVRPLN